MDINTFKVVQIVNFSTNKKTFTQFIVKVQRTVCLAGEFLNQFQGTYLRHNTRKMGVRSAGTLNARFCVNELDNEKFILLVLSSMQKTFITEQTRRFMFRRLFLKNYTQHFQV